MEEPVISLSLDGVQESNSSSVSLDIYCINFKNCKNIYPIKIVRPNNRFKYDEQEEIRNVVDDINNAGVQIDTCTCDNPKRSVFKCVKCHSSSHPCEYCESCAVKFKDNTMNKSKLTWPPTTMNGRPRTITGIRRIVNSIETSDEPLSNSYLKGIKGRSVLLDQPNFDYVLDSPAEYMHSTCLGLGKKMLEFSYNVGKKRPRKTKRRRTDPKHFNKFILEIRVPREFPRRVRNLDISVLKASEYRNILLFFFPIVLTNIGEKNKKESQLWLTFVFMIRSCVIPNEEFDNVRKQTIAHACELYYNLFFELYGQINCTYSAHVVSSHLFKIRGNVPLTERSAFKFESFYSEMKNLFKPGTKSPLKQILQNTVMKRSLEHHTCSNTILYTDDKKKNTMENNSLIYTYHNNEYNTYVISEINGDEFTCRKQGKFIYKTDILPNYDWKTVGVFKKGPIGNETHKILKKNVKGKFINVQNLIITCPINVLNEK